MSRHALRRHPSAALAEGSRFPWLAAAVTVLLLAGCLAAIVLGPPRSSSGPGLTVHEATPVAEPSGGIRRWQGYGEPEQPCEHVGTYAKDAAGRMLVCRTAADRVLRWRATW